MAQTETYRMPVAQARCEDLSRQHISKAYRETGTDPEVALAGLRARHSFLPFPSSYRLLLQVEWYKGSERHLHNDYFMLVEQADRTYRIEDLQVEPER